MKNKLVLAIGFLLIFNNSQAQQLVPLPTDPQLHSLSARGADPLYFPTYPETTNPNSEKINQLRNTLVADYYFPEMDRRWHKACGAFNDKKQRESVKTKANGTHPSDYTWVLLSPWTKSVDGKEGYGDHSVDLTPKINAIRKGELMPEDFEEDFISIYYTGAKAADREEMAKLKAQIEDLLHKQ